LDQFEVSKQKVRAKYDDERKRVEAEYRALEERYAERLRAKA